MKKKVNIKDIDFEMYLAHTLKSHGYMFPETDEQMAVFEEGMEYHPVAEELNSPELVFNPDHKKKTYRKKITPLDDDSENKKNWAIAAREGKDIPHEMLEQMKKDRDETRVKKDGDKEA